MKRLNWVFMLIIYLEGEEGHLVRAAIAAWEATQLGALGLVHRPVVAPVVIKASAVILAYP